MTACRRAKDKLALYTIGCPRVGNQAFLDAWSEKVPERWRTFNQHDSIPTMPRSTGFVHPTQGLCLMEQVRTGPHARTFRISSMHDSCRHWVRFLLNLPENGKPVI